MTPFDLPHIFVVFHPGAGGNFLSGLLFQILNNSLTELPVSQVGSSHLLAKDKAIGIEYLSFGTDITEQRRFTNQGERLEYYINGIMNSNIMSPQVTYTHDFTNIPLYEKYFPNSKILVITQQSIREKLVVTFFQVTKTILARNPDVPLGDAEWAKRMDMWETSVRNILKKLSVSEKHIEQIMGDRFNPEWYDILSYLTMLMFLDRYALVGAIRDGTGDDCVNYISEVSTSLYEKTGKPYTKGRPYSDFISDACMLLPFSYVLENDADTLVNTVVKLCGSIDTQKEDYIRSSFDAYRKKQNASILQDPRDFYLKTKQRAEEQIKQLR